MPRPAKLRAVDDNAIDDHAVPEHTADVHEDILGRVRKQHAVDGAGRDEGEQAAGERTVLEAVDAFLARPTSAATRRSYTQTLTRLTDAYGELPLGRLGAGELETFLADQWGGGAAGQADADPASPTGTTAAPATWNRHVATLRSFTAWCRSRGWVPAGADPGVGLERRREVADRTKAIAYPALERLWRRNDLPLREKTLWRLLYETAARAEEILQRNVEDLDLDNKRIRTVSKGGDVEWLHYGSGAARLLPRLVGGRRRGPLFLADRRPSPGRTPAAGDLCPDTGRGRLSYERAEYLFKRWSTTVLPRGLSQAGWTLHQLRHSALTHLAEDNVALPLLMAKSRHRNLRSLQRYLVPSADAVARLTAERDRNRRRPD